MDVGEWLRSLGLEQHETAFRENAVDAETLPTLTAQELNRLRKKPATNTRGAILLLYDGLEGRYIPNRPRFVNECCARFPFFRSLENRDLRNEAAIYTAVKQISLR
jgi:hypothetical protein